MSTSTSTIPILENRLALSRKETSKVLGISYQFVDLLIRTGRIRVSRVGAQVLVPRSEVLRLAGETISKG